VAGREPPRRVPPAFAHDRVGQVKHPSER
jgi:hypothetical protein